MFSQGLLSRRIVGLKDMLSQEELDPFFITPQGKELIPEIEKVVINSDGEVDFSTCSEKLKAYARMLVTMSLSEDPYLLETELKNNGNSKNATRLTMEYFDLVDAFFEECVGQKAGTFEDDGVRSFIGANRTLLFDRAQYVKRSYDKYFPLITSFFETNKDQLIDEAKKLEGLKCVVGGTSRFNTATFNGIRKIALYSDTVLISDPLIHWIEIERPEERFRLVQILEESFNLLKLKPLVDADLPQPPVFIFPGQELAEERSSSAVQDKISQLCLDFFGAFLGEKFEDESQIFKYANENKIAFNKQVSEKNLFIPPGDYAGNDPINAITHYKEYIRKFKSVEYRESIADFSDELLTVIGIFERLAPQMHVRRSAERFQAQPLFWLPVSFHYFFLCSEVTNLQLERSGVLKSQTVEALQSLQAENLAWLGNVPMTDLVRFRSENMNFEFRSKLKMYLDELQNSSLYDVDKVANTLTKGISRLLIEHDRDAKAIADKYDKRHFSTFAASILTAGATISPWLGPLTGAEGVIPLLAKLGLDLFEESNEKRKLSKSLLGILSHAAR